MPNATYYELDTRIKRKLKHTSKFYPVDLHCHTPLSPCFGRRNGESPSDLAATARDIAEAACGAGRFILAVVDHHRCEKAIEVSQAAEQIRRAGENLYLNNNLIVLPGMEISVEERGRTVHVLALFPETHSPAQIERVLDDTGIEPNPDHRREPSCVTRKRLIEIVSRIKLYGGLAVFAHVNSTNGYREEMRRAGRSADQILGDIIELGIDAVEVSSPADASHYIQGGKQIPCVIGSDAHYLREITSTPYITYVKMTKPSFEELKRALRDPETRIKLAEPIAHGMGRILGIEFAGGFLNGQIIAFTPNLNCLIGGRGAGKSTLIEAVRYILQLPVPNDRRQRVEEMRAEVFGGCTITLQFQGPTGELYLLRRTHGEPNTHIMDLNGTERTDIELSVTQNLKVQVYGWSEIEGIANSSTQQLDLIDAFIPPTAELKAEESRLLGNLLSNSRDIMTQTEIMNREQTSIGNLAELREELQRLGETETDEERKKTKAEFEVGLLKRISEQADILIQNYSEDSTVKSIIDIFLPINEALEQDQVLSISELRSLEVSLAGFIERSSVLRTARARELKELRRVSRVINATRILVASNHRAVSEAYERLLDRLAQPRDREIARRREYLRGEISRREQALHRKNQAEESLMRLRSTRQDLIRHVRDVRTRLYQMRSSHVDQIIRDLPRRATRIGIGIHIIAQGNIETFVNLLNTKLVGLSRHWRDRDYPQKIAAHFGPMEFADLLRNRNNQLLEQAGFSLVEAQDIIGHFDRKETDWLEFEECECSDRVIINLEVDGTPRPIEKLSPGQRCTALLPIILVETDSPLVIDQPEDNLDNQFVFDLVVDTLRRLKERRQVIVATHNPNIPVSGDAENIIVFRPEGQRGIIELNGSIDYPQVIEAVETLMEGGRDAFRLRMIKYGLS